MKHRFLVALCLLLAAPTAFAAAGKVLFVSGSVTLERGARAVKVGDALDVGDTVVTGPQSRAQILMADGARIALRAGSRFRLDDFALPSNVAQPGMAVAVAGSGKSVGTLLKGGFSTRDGAIAKSNPAAYEMRTPVGTLGIRGTYYTAVFCRGDCADVPGLPAGQPIADGLYLAVDEGTITFNGRGISLVLTAPAYEFIPLETSDPQQLTDPPAFLRNDGAGPLAAAGRPLQIAAENGPLADINERRSPTGAPGQSTAAVASDPSESIDREKSSDTPPEQRKVAITALGRTVNLTDPQIVIDPQTSVAAAVPQRGEQQPAFRTSNTQLTDTVMLNGTGSLLQFDSQGATYQSGTAALVDMGSNGATGIRWGRWSTGTATVTSGGIAQDINLPNSSLHWIVGPSFELVPVLPVSGSTNFVLAGGTTPTDTLGNAGTLNAALLTADFTAQQVSTTLSLDVDGLNWLATGAGPITAGTMQFGGTFTNVLVDGRVTGSGSFSGFFSAGATTPDQLNGVGLSYGLTDDLGQLGTVSGVAAFVPGTGQPLTPPLVQRGAAYAVGNIDQTFLASGAAVNTPTQLAVDANGNLTSFAAPLPRGVVGTLGIGTAANANTGFDAATGIRWGRWQGGAVNVTVAPNPSVPNSLAGEALHWIAGSGYGSTPVIPQTGTATYALVGNTDPTDTLGNVGTLGAASFSANFTTHTVASALSLTMAGRTWFASGTGTFGANSTIFTGNYNQISIDNLLAGNGNFAGFFAVPRVGAGTVAGAGLSYNIVGSLANLGIVSGALAFQEGNGAPVTPPPLLVRDLSIVAPDVFNQAQVIETPATDYTLNANFDLVGFTALEPGDPPELATYDIGTSAVAESDVDPALKMRWGRWSGGAADVTNIATGTVTALDLSQSSLHWVESGDNAAPPVLPVSGRIDYELAAWTTPTDRSGNLGTLNAATLSADFTAGLVTSSVDITIGGLNWQADGVGVIGAQLGLPAHQFSGVYNNGIIAPVQGTPDGTFSGFFTNTGAGLTYTLSDFNLGVVVDGAAVFRQP